MSETEIRQITEVTHKPRLLWLWVVAAVVLCLFAAGFSFWWPMYQANELIRSIREKGGEVEHMDPGSRWKQVFGTGIHPWLHEVHSVSMRSDSLSDRELVSLTSFPETEYLFLNVSRNSNEAIQQLENLTEVTYLQLIGDGQPVELTWICNLPDLKELRLLKLEVTQQNWESVMRSRVLYLKFYQCSIDAVPATNASLRWLDLQEVPLDGQLAAAIHDLSIRDLKLINCPSTSEFWTNLASHSALESLKLTDTQIDEQVVNSMVELRSLKKLSFEDSRTAMISREQIQTLGGLKTLEHLAFNGYVLPNDDSWGTIVRLPELKLIAIYNSPIGDDVIAQLAASSTLEWVILVNTNMTDEGLMRLVNMKSLKAVRLHHNGNTSEAYERFQTARPDLFFD